MYHIYNTEAPYITVTNDNILQQHDSTKEPPKIIITLYKTGFTGPISILILFEIYNCRTVCGYSALAGGQRGGELDPVRGLRRLSEDGGQLPGRGVPGETLVT